jgi:hypothetical protein
MRVAATCTALTYIYADIYSKVNRIAQEQWPIFRLVETGLLCRDSDAGSGFIFCIVIGAWAPFSCSVHAHQCAYYRNCEKAVSGLLRYDNYTLWCARTECLNTGTKFVSQDLQCSRHPGRAGFCTPLNIKRTNWQVAWKSRWLIRSHRSYNDDWIILLLLSHDSSCDQIT